jgi:hypothetical protein
VVNPFTIIAEVQGPPSSINFVDSFSSFTWRITTSASFIEMKIVHFHLAGFLGRRIRELEHLGIQLELVEEVVEKHYGH